MAGGCPQKYVTGAMVEGEIAAKAMVEDLAKEKAARYEMTEEEKAFCDNRFEEKIKEYDKILTNQSGLYDTEQLEEAMQKVMDTYAGGILSLIHI